MIWRIYSKRDKLEDQLVDAVAGILANEIGGKGFANLLVSGGSTPVGFFEKLSARKLQWKKINIALIDDRLDKNFSNEKLVNQLLLKDEAAQATFISLLPKETNVTSDLDIISDRTEVFIKNMDCVILGMGTDGHTASLFPGDPNSDRAMSMKLSDGHLAFTNAPSEPIKRITFSANAIEEAKNVFLHIYGENKKQILSQKENALPIAKVLSKCGPKSQIFFAK